MKVKRQKRAQRYLGFYKNNFGFRKPYQILIDGTFCLTALKYKVNIGEQMPKYLDSEVKLFTTPCVVTEIEKLGPQLYGAMVIVKQYPVRKCGHEKKPIPGGKCFYSMCKNGNTDHYFVATQDRELSEKVRRVPGVPLLYMSYNAINLDKPSEYSEKAADKKIAVKSDLTDFQSSMLKELKREEFGEEEIVVRRKKKIKGANPLSIKKSKKKVNIRPSSIAVDTKATKRKRHRRIKLAKHVELSSTAPN